MISSPKSEVLYIYTDIDNVIIYSSMTAQRVCDKAVYLFLRLLNFIRAWKKFCRRFALNKSICLLQFWWKRKLFYIHIYIYIITGQAETHVSYWICGRAVVVLVLADSVGLAVDVEVVLCAPFGKLGPVGPSKTNPSTWDVTVLAGV